MAKVKRGLSAGRVQSVALRMICDREAEIDAFIPKEYWTIEGKFTSNVSKKFWMLNSMAKRVRWRLPAEKSVMIF